MNYTIIDYLIYLPASVLLTCWVATTLFRHGRRFLLDVFHGDEGLADSVNHLLVVGFYLINLGYISLELKLETAPDSAAGVFEALAGKLGLVLLVLGLMHFGNLGVLAKLRQNSRLSRGPGDPSGSPPPAAPPFPAYAGEFAPAGVQPPAIG
jgi:hypothetical protein